MVRRTLLSAFLAATLTVGAAADTARAQDTNFQVEQFEPLHAQGLNILNTATTRVLPHLRPSFGLALHYADDELQLVPDANQAQILSRLISWQFKGELWAGIGIADVLDIGVVMPVAFSQNAVAITDVQQLTTEKRDDFALGDLRVVPKVTFVDLDGFGIGLLATIYLPTGDEDSYHSEGSVRVEPRLVLDYKTEGGFVIAANLGYQIRGERRLLNHISDDVLRWNLAVEVPVLPDSQLAIIASVFGGWGVQGDDIDTNKTLPLEALAGLNWWPAENVIVQAAGGLGLTGGVGAPDFRVYASVGFTPRTPGVVDTDGDGINDDQDACPTEPEDKDGFEDKNGCPDPDNDGDGVPDIRDGVGDAMGYGTCRDIPEDKDGFQDDDGCPDPDNDGDGFPDVNDGAVGPAGFGACMNEPEDKDGFEDDGCPDPDNDGDGVPDVTDGDDDGTGFGECRDQPETVNGYLDSDGCPDERPLVVVSEDCTAIEIGDKVYFKTAKAKILKKSFSLLDQVAAAIKTIPDYDYIMVEGHTDSRGSSGYNRRLSARRAKSVRTYLIASGIPTAKLKSKGFGEDSPIAPNDSDENMAKNRRVEFKVVGAKCTK